MCSVDRVDIDIKEYSLEEHLEIKCKNNEKYKHLYAAWTTDKDIYTNALLAVPVNFPHYSKHEASHSLSIVNKIEMILGVERIKGLSPTDTFLILESAFSHDLGMIIPESLLKSEWKKSSFRRFLKRISTDGFNEDEMKAAKYLLGIQEKNFEFNEENRGWPIEVRDSVILITAEYFRKNHGARSELWLKQSEEIAACINANKFIPERLMKIVGKVATAHGREFDDVFNNLEHIQNGIGVDEIHPRFIACLIRLGDLLDLDNGRFNEVFEKTSPSPKSSKIHKEKHRSITHFLVSPERIEVSAVCENDMVYRETRLWFDWLSDELKNLSSKWSDIVPIGFKGGPPSLGDIKLSIKGAEDITEQLNLRFNIDPIRAFELIEGNGIYKDELVFIRELLQNAMDATKIKIWKDIKSKKYDDVWGIIDSDFEGKVLSEYDFNFPKQLPEKLKGFYPIKISVSYEEANDGIDENLYIFTIEDRGCGISLNDLKRMESVGGSWEQDDELQDFIEKMPGWLQPTGSFGIGLHSIFLITDEMKIETKSDKEDGYNISFISRRKNGYITVNRDTSICNTGTKIIIKIKESKLETMVENKNISDCNYDYFDIDYRKRRIISMLKYRIGELIKNIVTLNVSLKLLGEEVIIKKDHVKNILPYEPWGEYEELKYYIGFNEYEEFITSKKERVKNWDVKIEDKAYETVVNLRVDCSQVGVYRDDRIKIGFKEIDCKGDVRLEFENYELFNIAIDIKKGIAREILAVSRDVLNENMRKDYMNRLEKIIIPRALEQLYKKLCRLIKKDTKYFHKEIDEKVESNFQLLKLRLAFIYFLNKEEIYMKEWGRDVEIYFREEYTFDDILKSDYIILGGLYNTTENIVEKANELKIGIGEKKIIHIESNWTEFDSYLANNFSEIKRVAVKTLAGNLRYLKLKKRKQQVQILGENSYINCFANEEEAKSILKRLFDIEYKNRIRIPCIAYLNEENNYELLYKDIIISNELEEIIVSDEVEDSDDSLEVKNNSYFISPFKENCDNLIRLFDYDINSVVDLLKKEHNFDRLVEWVSKNAIYKVGSKDHKKKVIKTYTKLLEDYLELLKKDYKQIMCSKEIVEDESKLNPDEAAVSKDNLNLDSDRSQITIDDLNNIEVEEQLNKEEKKDK